MDFIAEKDYNRKDQSFDDFWNSMVRDRDVALEDKAIKEENAINAGILQGIYLCICQNL